MRRSQEVGVGRAWVLAVRILGLPEADFTQAWRELRTYSLSFAAFIHRYTAHRSPIARNREVWQE